ncbi:gibberellin-44 dioxygenase, partial [Sarracenia purpurea var. burkii]
MSDLALGIMELLGMSLGVSRARFKEFFRRKRFDDETELLPTMQKTRACLGNMASFRSNFFNHPSFTKTPS